MSDDYNVTMRLYVIMLDATAVSAPNYSWGDRHAMLAFTEANEVDDAYTSIKDALEDEGWSDIKFGRVKDITGNISNISDDVVRQHAEAAYTHQVSFLIYTPAWTTLANSMAGNLIQ